MESAKKDAILLHRNDCSKVYLEPKRSLTQEKPLGFQMNNSIMTTTVVVIFCHICLG